MDLTEALAALQLTPGATWPQVRARYRSLLRANHPDLTDDPGAAERTAPLVTEKNHVLQEEENKYVFEVARDVNKLEIKQAIEEIFDVRVVSVRTLRMKGKVKRLGRFEGRRPDWKKAIVKLVDGDIIDLYTGT